MLFYEWWNDVLLLLSQKRGHRKKRNRVSPVEGPGVEFSGRVARQVASTVRSELALMDAGSGGVQLVHMWPIQVGASWMSYPTNQITEWCEFHTTL